MHEREKDTLIRYVKGEYISHSVLRSITKRMIDLSSTGAQQPPDEVKENIASCRQGNSDTDVMSIAISCDHYKAYRVMQEFASENFGVFLKYMAETTEEEKSIGVNVLADQLTSEIKEHDRLVARVAMLEQSLEMSDEVKKGLRRQNRYLKRRIEFEKGESGE
ncbi:hypothetical protein EBB07_00880 [Paenibacillaceae bacterium]|nr:hypothetical protein EBB07_00880 [Paenibacillaceae bacterium]